MDPKKSKELPEPVKKFYKGEPLALGITQILIGILGILFGVVLNVTTSYRFNYFTYAEFMTPYWTGVPFIISGSLSVAAARNSKPSLVKGMLGMNTVSAVAAGIGIVFLCTSLSSAQWAYRYECSDYHSSYIDPQCHEYKIIPYNIMVGVMAVLLLFAVLEFCISISGAAFGCKTVCLNVYTETVVVVYQNNPLGNAVSLPAACRDVESP